MRGLIERWRRWRMVRRMRRIEREVRRLRPIGERAAMYTVVLMYCPRGAMERQEPGHIVISGNLGEQMELASAGLQYLTEQAVETALEQGYLQVPKGLLN